ncbi:alpha/beta fold hydrolase [Nonomuraea fuscirosea]|uniref:alpha/beta fold hydrolase n=1 Tax=Nonomuraea fuscirosea TaxID=1291556 RepID=UPI0034159BBC
MASFGRLAGRAVAGAVVLALSPVLGLAALAGTAMVGARPQVFAVTGLAVFASVFFLGLLLCVPRPAAGWGRWTRAVVLLGVEAAVVWQVSAATLRPPAVPAAPAKVAGQREWRLETGSRLAYVRVSPRRVTRPEPVVFLHGGPGVGDLAGDSAFLGKLAADGFRVYVYDQLGAGRSGRLADPRGYGLTRDVADLEAVRLAIGAERLNLVARDYGAQLAAAYLAQHPARVARAVLYSPAGLTGLPPGRTGDHPRSSAVLLGPGPVPDPRTLAVSTLLQVDPVAAHAFAGDPELATHLNLLRHQTPPPCPPSDGKTTGPGTTGPGTTGPGTGSRVSGGRAIGSGVAGPGVVGPRAAGPGTVGSGVRGSGAVGLGGAGSGVTGFALAGFRSDGFGAVDSGPGVVGFGQEGDGVARLGWMTAESGALPRSGGEVAALDPEAGAASSRPGGDTVVPGPEADAAPAGYGGYVALAGRAVPASVRRGLGAVEAPVLIVKGPCDAQSWAEAADYRNALPDARFAYAAGDDGFPGRGTAYLGLLRAFLTDRPVDAYEAEGPPPDYRGPA